MKKVLVVEDDKFLANAYRVKLTKASYEVRIATDGEEAIACLASFMPDLILLDLIMPKKDGFSTLADLKANDAWKQIPVLVTSNLGQKEDIDRAMSLGASGFIVKTDSALNEVMAKINLLIK